MHIQPPAVPGGKSQPNPLSSLSQCTRKTQIGEMLQLPQRFLHSRTEHTGVAAQAYASLIAREWRTGGKTRLLPDGRRLFVNSVGLRRGAAISQAAALKNRCIVPNGTRRSTHPFTRFFLFWLPFPLPLLSAAFRCRLAHRNTSWY